jgi:hypothetical protein
VQATSAEPLEVVRKDSASPFSSPAVLTLVALLAASLIGNLVLIGLLLAR